MGGRERKYGFSFSWRRAIGLSALKGRISRAIGIPLTREGRQRKVGAMLGCCVPLAILVCGPVVLGIVVAATIESAHALDCSSSSQSDMNDCAGKRFEKADAELNARFKTIVACLEDDAKPLVAAQRLWIKFRDAECAFQAGKREDGGSAWPMVMDACLQGLTDERSKDLNYYLTCQEGDLSCPTFRCRFPKPDRTGK